MNPAFSVIVFTTASGAGYGLLAWLGLANALDRLPPGGACALVCLACALLLVSGGLLSSLLHLGHPRRAWRSFSQWRSSWLSREGVMAVVSFVPALVLGAGLVVQRPREPLFLFAGLVATACALATVFTTAMIYASLRTVAAWNERRVPALYLLLALATGLVLLNALEAVFGADIRAGAWLACALLAAGAALKWSYWRAIDSAQPASSAESATGLGHLGTVTQLHSPHERDNFVLKEMGFRIARRHARKLRRITLLLLFALPLAASLLAALAGGAIAAFAAWIALLAAIPGVLIERWLFFAEAKHVAALYYGRP